jgi:hypothetical protein
VARTRTRVGHASEVHAAIVTASCVIEVNDFAGRTRKSDDAPHRPNVTGRFVPFKGARKSPKAQIVDAVDTALQALDLRVSAEQSEPPIF